MFSCPQWARNCYKDFKLNHPARTYNVIVDHSRRVLGSTLGHPGSYNDKTLILYDSFVSSVNDGKIPNDFEFNLFERNQEGDVVEACYKGVWFMVGNGYLSWSCTVPPSTNGTTYEMIRFSKWVEYIRKDVECKFGILKGRFTILRYGFRLQSIYCCD